MYKKYADQGDWQTQERGFADYLVDIKKLGTNIKTQYKTNAESPKKSPPKNGNTNQPLKFDSNFESGNLYAAYEVLI